MANITIPGLTALSANVADGDLFETADISNSDASRKVTRLEIIGVGSTGITTLGTIATGVWSGTAIVVSKGGSGAVTLTGTLIGNGTSAFTAATSSTTGEVLRCTGANTFAYGPLNLTETGTTVTGDLAVVHLNGGINADATTFWRGDGSWVDPGTFDEAGNYTLTGTWDFSSATVTFGTVSITTINATSIVFEGATPDAFETTLGVTDPTADRTINLPDVSGDVVVTTSGVLAANVTLGEALGQIILDPTLSADGTWSGIQTAGTAGATLAFGDLIYLAVADSRWELADADAAASAGDVVLGMCVLAAASDGDPTNVLLFGKIRADAAFPTLTVGAAAYVGTTPGDIQVAQPSGTDDVIRSCGIALTADSLFFNPSNSWITHT